MLEKWLVIVPARLNSTRLESKLIQDVSGIPLIVRTYNNLDSLLYLGAQVVVATDSKEISKICQHYNIPTVMTGDHESGTDRCNEAAEHYTRPYILNVQGDEPTVSTEDLLKMMKAMEADGSDMGTMVYCSNNVRDAEDESVVKVVRSDSGNALYFSRALIPHNSNEFWHHVGVYGFKRLALERFCNTKPTSLEKVERLEQLRALQIGLQIKTYETNHKPIGVDTEKDLIKIRSLFGK